ncbi:hypothetical protein IJT17_09730 [bacterium]|nr:hypothetical protein [bacterium]
MTDVSSAPFEATRAAGSVLPPPALLVDYKAQLVPEIGCEQAEVYDTVWLSSGTALYAPHSPEAYGGHTAPQSGCSAARADELDRQAAEAQSWRLAVRVHSSMELGANMLSQAADEKHGKAKLGAGSHGAESSAHCLSGDVQAAATACRVNAMFDSCWNGSPVYRRPGSETLMLELGHPKASSCGPFYAAKPARAIYTDSAETSADPDIIAHEQGHAILDSYYHYCTGNSFVASAHEAFADVTAMLASLQSAQVRECVRRSWDRGEISTPASVIGEGAQKKLAGENAARPGLRDISSAPAPLAEVDFEEPHEAGRRFSHGLYAALRDMYVCELASHPELAPAAAMERVCQRVSADFVNSVRYLPKQPVISQRDLAQALLKANSELRAGAEISFYRSALAYLLDADNCAS